ncbi:MAG: Lrp/AsnC family transcriptional regulator [Thermoplasmatales archaeon]|nr:Lrp/AsnC family transcriptional regulator [Thermoplasmatales archaeon]
MPKSSKKQIDEDDKTFLKMLQKNSGDSPENIAKKCGFSRQKVWRIKKRLEKDKTIWGYPAVVDDEKFDVTRYIMLVKRSSKPIGDAINKMINPTFQKKGEEVGVNIISGGYLHGKYDWVIIFTAEDIKNAKKLGEILFTEYPQMIKEVEIMEYVFTFKEGGMENPEMKKMLEFF